MAFNPSSFLNFFKRKSGPPVPPPPPIPQPKFGPIGGPDMPITARPEQPVNAPIEPSIALQQRPRVVKPLDPYEKSVAFGRDLAADPNLGTGGVKLEKPSRLKSALMQALAGAGRNADAAIQSGNVGWGGVASALGGAAGAGAMGAADPGIILKARHDQAVAENQAEQDRGLEQMQREAAVENIRAQAEERRQAPQIAREKAQRDQAKEDRITRLEERRIQLAEDVAAGRKTEAEARAAFNRDKLALDKEELAEKKRAALAREARPAGGENPDKLAAEADAEEALAEAAKTEGNAHEAALGGIYPEIAKIKAQLAEQVEGEVEDKEASILKQKQVMKKASVPKIPKDSPQRAQLEEQLNRLEKDRVAHDTAMNKAYPEMNQRRANARKFRRPARAAAGTSAATPARDPLGLFQ